MFYRILHILDFLALALAITIAATGDAPRLTGTSDRVRSFTREIEFDYPNWVGNATWIKLEQAAIGLPYLFTRTTRIRTGARGRPSILLATLGLMARIVYPTYLPGHTTTGTVASES